MPFSRRGSTLLEAELNALSIVQSSWLEEIRKSWENDEVVQVIIAKLIAGTEIMEGYTYANDTLRYQRKLYVSSNGNLRHKIIEELHNSGTGGHSGIRATLKRISQIFFWPSLQTEVTKAVKECLICQRNKGEHVPYPGLLQPNPIPTRPWSDIAMDFIEGLPNSDHKQSILVVVDRFSKYGHFIPLSHPYTAKDIATVFFNHIHNCMAFPQPLSVTEILYL